MNVSTRPKTVLLNDFALFCRAQLETKDVDPLYPILRGLQDGMEPDQAVWHSLVYVAFYNVMSAEEFFNFAYNPRFVSKAEERLFRLPTGTERRGLRDYAKMKAHLLGLAGAWAYHGSWEDWLQQGFEDDPLANWNMLNQTLQTAYQNGRWASYKTAEILMTVNDYPVEPPNMGMAFSSGPRKGLALFFPTVEGNSPKAIAQLDYYGEVLRLSLAAEPYNVPLTVSELETMLCDFHSMVEGHYYVGHDIDQMLAQLHSSRAPQWLKEKVWYLRQRTFDEAYLGEVLGWTTVDSERCRQYRDFRHIALRARLKAAQ